jgi:DNA-binding NarL/FixJ family response regulator
MLFTMPVSAGWLLAQAVPLAVVIFPSHRGLGTAQATGAYLAFGGFAMGATYLRQRELLEGYEDIEVIAEAADGEEALRLLTGSAPDLALLDVRMPKLTGVQVVQRLRRAGKTTPAILLTTFDDEEALRDGMEAGIQGYLLKDVSREKLAEAVRTVAGGGKVIRPAVTERASRLLSKGPAPFPSAELPESLTRRELEILRLMAAGLTNGEIAARLGTAEGTVKNHTSHILSKLGVRDRTQAVLKALELGQL